MTTPFITEVELDPTRGMEKVRSYHNDLNDIIVNLSDKVKNLVELFDKKQTLKDLMLKCIENENIQIYIGDESGTDLLADCSLISAPYQKNNKTVGVLGVIGPKRMDYERIVEIVDFTAKMFSKN